MINATSILVNSVNQKSIKSLASDLKKIETNIKGIEEIILRGGGALDLILGLTPNDFDLFYSFNDKNNSYIETCICDDIKKQLANLTFESIDQSKIELENSYEKQPKLPPIKTTVGIFSIHTDYNSQFAINSSGEIYTNADALNYFLNNIYEIRYEGFIPWAYYSQEKNDYSYWAFYVYIFVRGIGYILKRNMIPGKNFLALFEEADFLISKGIEKSNIETFKQFFLMKIGSFENLEQFLDSYFSKEKSKKLKKIFSKLK